MSRRGTVHRNETGNSYDRRARRARLWRELSANEQIKCHHCPRLMSKEEFEVDRFPGAGGNRPWRRCVHRPGKRRPAEAGCTGDELQAEVVA